MNGVHPRNHQNGPYKGVNFGTYIPRFSFMDTRPYQQAPFKTILLVHTRESVNRENKNRATSAREDGLSSSCQSRKWGDTFIL